MDSYLYDVKADEETADDYIVNETHYLPGNFLVPHYHDGIEVICFFGGSGIVQIDGQRIVVQQGDIVICNSREVHGIFAEKDLHYYYVILKRSFFKKYKFPYKTKPLQRKVCDGELSEYCRFICSNDCRGGKWDAEKILAYVLLLAVKLYSEYTDTEKETLVGITDRKNELVMRAMDYIGDHITKTMTTEEIAEYLGYSPYYICKVFKKITKYTIKEYTNRLKCSKAVHDLKSGEYTVYETANKYGFENFSYFSKVFKQYTGKSPSYFIPAHTENQA